MSEVAAVRRVARRSAVASMHLSAVIAMTTLVTSLLVGVAAPATASENDVPRFASPHSSGPVVYLAGDSGGIGMELWRSDGTLGGTALVKDINPGPSSSLCDDTIPECDPDFTDAAGYVYFLVFASGGGREVWRSDGTAAGTTQVTNSARDGISYISEIAGSAGGVVYLTGRAAGVSTVSMWAISTAGTVTEIISGGGAHKSRFVTNGGNAFFENGSQVWVSDGTPLGTHVVGDAHTVPSTGSQLVAAGGKVYFRGLDPVEHVGDGQMWVTDGSVTGTRRAFAVGSGSPALGAAADRLVYDEWAGPAPLRLLARSATPSAPVVLASDWGQGEFEQWNGRLYRDWQNWGETDSFLGVTDGTTGGTQSLRVPGRFTRLSGGSHTLFLGIGTGLWKSDGTLPGSEKVADLAASQDDAELHPAATSTDRVVVTNEAQDNADGRPGGELYLSDGTAAGTVPFVPLAVAPTPLITGTPRVGVVLTAVAGVWAPAPVALGYQWYSSGVAIARATASTYSPTATDLGKRMTVSVTGAKAGYAPTTVASAATTAVVAGILVAPIPTVSGPVAVGGRLIAAPGSWGPAPVTLSYQWYAAGAAIAGATSSSYVVGSGLVGKSLQVKVTGSEPGYVTAAKTSMATIAVPTAKKLTATPVPTIRGTVALGGTLTAVPGTWSPAPVTLGYQWYASGVAISGAVAAGFTITTAQVGKKLAVRVTGSKVGYTTVATSSAASITVPPPKALTATPTPTITGTAKVGQTLTAVPGTWAPAPVTLHYQWYANGVVVSGATAATVTITAAAVGKKLSVAVSGSKVGYTRVTKTSAATASVVK